LFSYKLQPSFSETDALGHVNNTVVPVWFEQAREPIFKIFVPDLSIANWNLIIAHIEVDFLSELVYGEEVEIQTGLSKLGNSSMTIVQTAWQKGEIRAKGQAVMIHYNYAEKSAVAIPDAIRTLLSAHLQTAN
jgi:acyl-CoA thioester hydrolase